MTGKKRELLKVTDNDGLIIDGEKLFKIHHYGKDHTLHYVEINPEEYDKRIQSLAEQLASYPQVKLLDVMKDALYDLPLKLLEKLEGELQKELKKAEPQIATKTAQRGTCVDLMIGNKFATILRE